MSYEKFLSKNHNGGYLDYYYSCPAEGEKFPLVFYIHGAGSRGSDVKMLEKNTALSKIIETAGDKCIISAPQCHDEFWFNIFDVLTEFVKEQISRPNVDTSRVYIIGSSMGAYTTWQLCLSHPDWFSAAIPICGGGMYWAAENLKNLPIWAFHGALDSIVLCEESIKMVRAINRAGGNARLTVFPQIEHSAWTPTLSSEETWAWLFKQKKNF